MRFVMRTLRNAMRAIYRNDSLSSLVQANAITIINDAIDALKRDGETCNVLPGRNSTVPEMYL